MRGQVPWSSEPGNAVDEKECREMWLKCAKMLWDHEQTLPAMVTVAGVNLRREVCVDTGVFWGQDGGLRDFGFVEFLLVLKRGVVASSTPGLPWMDLGCATNQAVVDCYPWQLYLATLEVLDWCLNGGDRPSLGLRVFGKREDLPEEKVARKGCRQITNLPLHWIIAEHVIFGHLVDHTIKSHEARVQKPGMGLHDDGLRKLEAWVRSQRHVRYDLDSNDVGNFDDCVTLPMQRARVALQTYRQRFKSDCEWTRCALRFEHALVESPLVFPWGVWYARVENGLFWRVRQVTGRLETADGNSDDRAMMDLLPCVWFNEPISIPIMTMGDDDVCNVLRGRKPLYRAALVAAGFNYKEEELGEGELFSFCSHTFYADGRRWASPQGFWKSVYSVLGDQPTVERYGQWLTVVRHHPLLSKGNDLLWSSGWLQAAGLVGPLIVGSGF